MSREVALKNADFVINTALVGGHDHQETQRAAGEKHGYYNAPGRNYNQLRFILSVARDMENICPDAWLIQKRLFLRMLLDDNRTRSLEQAEAVMEEILSLPFNREMAENMAE